jgi:hypothetical protein
MTSPTAQKPYRYITVMAWRRWNLVLIGTSWVPDMAENAFQELQQNVLFLRQ